LYVLRLILGHDTEMAPFEKVAVFGLKARRTGYWVPDEFVATFVAHAPEALGPRGLTMVW